MIAFPAARRPTRRSCRIALVAVLAGALGAAAGCGPRQAPESAQSPRRARHRERAQAQAAERALQLATFDHAWRRIADTYPHADFHGLDWEGVRRELRPRAEECRNARQLRPVLEDMLSRLGESHFQILPGEAAAAIPAPLVSAGDAAPPPAAAPTSGGDIGLEVRRLGDEVVAFRVDPDGPAAAAGIAPGWTIEAVGGLHARDVLAGVRDVPAPSAKYLTWALLNGAMRGAPGSSVAVQAAPHDGTPRTLQLVRRPARGMPSSLGNLTGLVADFESRTLPGDVRYVRFSMFLAPVAQPFTDAVRAAVAERAPGLVIDLRGNPGGIGGLVMGMGGHFVREPGKSLGAMTTREGELNFVANPRGPGLQYDGPVAVLVDGLSLSTSELFAAGLQQVAGARVFGERTGGMALPSVVESLPNGDRMQFAVADLTAPGGRRLEGVGVTPDEEVPLAKEDLLAGRDAPLDAALRWIRTAPQATSSSHFPSQSPSPSPSPDSAPAPRT